MNNSNILKHGTIALAFGLITAACTTLAATSLLNHPRLFIIVITGLWAIYLSVRMFLYLKHRAFKDKAMKDLDDVLKTIINAEEKASKRKPKIQADEKK